jgi:hypothetical protein
MLSMDVRELAAVLDGNGIRPDAYDLEIEGFSLPNDTYCIRKEGGARWVTYYSERGERVGEKAWITEAEACQALLGQILEDRGTRRTPPP